MDGPTSTLPEDTQVQPVQQTQSQPQSLPPPPIQTQQTQAAQNQTTTQTQPQPSAQLQPQTQPQPQLSPQQPQLQSQPQTQPQPQAQAQQPQYQMPQQAAVIQQTQGAKPSESTPFVYAAYAKLSNNPAVPVKPQTPQTFTSPLNTATSVSTTQSTRPAGLDPTQMLVQNLIVFMSKMQEQQEEKLKAFQTEVEKRLTAQEAMLRDLLAASKAIKDSQQQNTVQLLQKLNALQAGKARDESAGGMYPQPPTLGLAAQPASPQTAPSKPKDASFDLSKQYARTPSTSGVQQPAVQAAAAYPKPVGQVAGVQMSQSQFQPQMQPQVQPQLQVQLQPQFQPQQQLQPQMQPQPLYPMAAEYRQTPSYPSSLPYAAPASSAYAAPQTSYDSDYELAKKLQADFDTEAKRSSAAASSKGGAPTGGSTAAKENKESCPVCGLKVETSQLNSHVNGHFDDDEPPAKASSAVTPGGPEENSSIWSRLFGGGGGGGKPKAEEKSEKESKPAAASPSAAVPPNVQPQAVPYALPGGAIPYYYAPAQANFLPGVQTGAGPYRPGVPVNPVYYSAEPVLYSPPPPH